MYSILLLFRAGWFQESSSVDICVDVIWRSLLEYVIFLCCLRRRNSNHLKAQKDTDKGDEPQAHRFRKFRNYNLGRRICCWFCWATFIYVPMLDLMGQGLQTFSCKMIFVYINLQRHRYCQCTTQETEKAQVEQIEDLFSSLHVRFDRHNSWTVHVFSLVVAASCCMLLPCLKGGIIPDVDLIESDANSEKAVEAPCSLLAISSMRFSYPTWQNHAKSMNPRGAEHLKRFLLDQVGWIFLKPVGSFWLWERTLVIFVDIRWEQRCQGQAWR